MLAQFCMTSLHVRMKWIPDNGISPHWTSDIFKALLAQIGKLDCDLFAHLIVGGRREADAARLGDAFESCCDVDAVPKDGIALDQDVAEVDPDAKEHAPLLRSPGVTLGHDCLDGPRASHRIDDRGELQQQA